MTVVVVDVLALDLFVKFDPLVSLVGEIGVGVDSGVLVAVCLADWLSSSWVF